MRGYVSFARNIVKSNYARLDFPYKLTYAITYRCNYRCRMCNIWQMRPPAELTLKEIGSFFQRSNRFNWIDFTGGETWLRSDFVDIIDIALESCQNLVLLHFPTNGFLTERIVRGVEKIVKLRPPKLMITVSMDGDEAVNDSVRGVKGGWRRQIATYRELHAIPGVEVVLGMTVSSLNAGQYHRAFAAAKAECPWLKSTDFHLNVAHESAHYYRNVGKDVTGDDPGRVVEQVNQYRALRGGILGPVGYLEGRYLGNAEKYLTTRATPMRCQALSSSCFIDPSGNVYPCGMYDSELGNLRDFGFDLQALWNTPRAEQLQREIWAYKCPQCWTPCEAYQSILGNLLGLRNKSANGRNHG